MRCTPTPAVSGCRPWGRRFAGSRSLDALVQDYIRTDRPRQRAELEFFRRMPSLQLAIRAAGYAEDHRGKRFSHQRRLKRISLHAACVRLSGIQPVIRGVISFEQLLQLIEDALRDIRGIGELYCYDTALRLGAYLNLVPQVVHLHAGARLGAGALRLDVSRRSINPRTLAVALRRLRPHEVENFLCIFREAFVGL